MPGNSLNRSGACSCPSSSARTRNPTRSRSRCAGCAARSMRAAAPPVAHAARRGLYAGRSGLSPHRWTDLSGALSSCAGDAHDAVRRARTFPSQSHGVSHHASPAQYAHPAGAAPWASGMQAQAAATDPNEALQALQFQNEKPSAWQFEREDSWALKFENDDFSALQFEDDGRPWYCKTEDSAVARAKSNPGGEFNQASPSFGGG